MFNHAEELCLRKSDCLLQISVQDVIAMLLKSLTLEICRYS